MVTAFLEWWNFMFALPLVAGLILSAVMAFSGLGTSGTDHATDAHADTDTDPDSSDTDSSDTGSSDAADADHDASHDADHAGNGESRGFQLGQLFGLGEGAPLSVMLPMLLSAWGLGGLLLNAVLSPVLRFPAVFAPLSVVGGLIVAMFAGRALTGVLKRVLETNRRTNISRGGLVGCAGHAAFQITPSLGAANVRDPYGNIHRVEARCHEGVIASGTEILVYDFVEPDGVYFVKSHPIPSLAASQRP